MGFGDRNKTPHEALKGHIHSLGGYLFNISLHYKYVFLIWFPCFMAYQHSWII